MIYSVWDQSKRAYDYYKTKNGHNKVNSPAPKHIPSQKLGTTIPAAAWPLPAGAKHIGSGDTAKGRVAQRRGLGGLGAFEGGAYSLVWPALALVGIYFWTRK